MTAMTRLLSTAVIMAAVFTALSAAPACAARPEPAVLGELAVLDGPVAAAGDLWDSLRAGTFGALEYGVSTVRSLTGWLIGSGPAEPSGGDEGHGLLNMSDKEFREFDGAVRAAGYGLQGCSFGLDGSTVELNFDFERVISERERADLRRMLDQQNGPAGLARRSIILALLDATRYVDAPPASGYRLAGVWMRPGTPPDVRVRFRRIKP
ncbi:MAG: hypothetical protein WCF85_05070 [Rhodospirillaceae bacterium]